MSNKDKKKPDSRPTYVSPRVIRLDDVSTGIGAGCGSGSSPTAGSCRPTGNGAKVACDPVGHGF